MFLGLFEHVANARGADADKHFHKIGTGDREERHLGFAGNRFRQQRFARSRAAHQQYAPRDTPAEVLEFGRVAQEVHQLGYFFLGFVASRHIGKREAFLALIQHARTRLAERECAALATALHLAHEEYPYADQQDHREP
jgi:hypothetical protein